MSAIEASSVRVQTMVDGTFRLVVDIEPRFGLRAFELFGMPGTPLALAALKTQKAEQQPEPEPKGGALAKLAGMWCNDPEFWQWIRFEDNASAHDAKAAADWLRSMCSVNSRAELDNDSDAGARFQRRVRLPYMKWRVTQGLVA